jgi:NitT/TauT family transport system substrate-binding protein
VFRGDWESREGWGWHDLEQWRLFFDTIHEIGQISAPIAAEEVISNKYVPAANQFETERVEADAEGYALPEEFEAVDVEAIRARI